MVNRFGLLSAVEGLGEDISPALERFDDGENPEQ